jgi:hypothetical protein
MQPVSIVALILALVAIAIGIVGATGDDDAFERQTLSLTEEVEDERALDVGREPAFTYSSPVSGDAEGEVAGTCLPVGDDGIACETTYFLADGTITTQNARFADSPEIVAPIIGGTGAYEGALGTLTIPDPDSHEHTLELLIPAD